MWIFQKFQGRGFFKIGDMDFQKFQGRGFFKNSGK